MSSQKREDTRTVWKKEKKKPKHKKLCIGVSISKKQPKKDKISIKYAILYLIK